MAEEPAYIRDLKVVTRGSIGSAVELFAHEAELYGPNDRATAILFGSLVERSLEDLLKTKMRPEGIGKIFGSDGILSSFSNKIHMAYSLNLLGPISRHDLNIIRVLRNEFAHSTRPIDFSAQEVKPVCDALQILDNGEFAAARAVMRWSEKDKKFEFLTDESEPKTRFMLTCHDLSYRMLAASGKAGITIESLLIVESSWTGEWLP